MTAKEYLQQAYMIDREIDLDIIKLEAKRAAFPGKTCESYEREINAKIDKLVEKRLEIEKAIDAVPDARYREILTRRYLLHQAWDLISEQMGYSLSHLYKLHGSALQKISVPHSQSE